jgi:hypothetical protein
MAGVAVQMADAGYPNGYNYQFLEKRNGSQFWKVQTAGGWL